MDVFLDNFTIKYNPKHQSKRRCFRIRANKFKIVIDNHTYQVRDLSSTGVSFWKNGFPSFQKGASLEGMLLIKDKPLLKAKLRVVREDKDFIACEFEGLTRRDVLKLDKIVLEVQKRYLAKLKMKRFKELKQEDEET
ncbi:MAG: PilZ domain-containing protein [Desulfonauticus sp.]|nr:PilZ domain-containing protein [Desulfonauticus sp.]